jgi:hypothetical protein
MLGRVCQGHADTSVEYAIKCGTGRRLRVSNQRKPHAVDMSGARLSGRGSKQISPPGRTGAGVSVFCAPSRYQDAKPETLRRLANGIKYLFKAGGRPSRPLLRLRSRQGWRPVRDLREPARPLPRGRCTGCGRSRRAFRWRRQADRCVGRPGTTHLPAPPRRSRSAPYESPRKGEANTPVLSTSQPALCAG